ncbi:hypothetical protein ES703_03769 [subsurface metagenome]
MRPGVINEDLDRLSQAVNEGCSKASGSGKPEAVLREHVQLVLGEALRNRGARATARNEAVLVVPPSSEAAMLDAPLTAVGRADAIYNRFVIEFEPPDSLRPSVAHSATRHAIEQVQQYLQGIAHVSHIKLDRLAGCAFDGRWIIYVTWERGDWRITRPQRVDRSSLRALVETLVSLSEGRGLTAENLDEDFGRKSDMGRIVIGTLIDPFLKGTVSGRTVSMFDQWSIDVGNASGPFSIADLDDWAALCSTLGVPNRQQVSLQVLFCLQTYFALISKMVALVILEGATGHQLVKELIDSTTIWEGLGHFESGELTAVTRTVNAIEPGIFSWYLGERSDSLEQALKQMVSMVAEYSAEVVEITPLAARDVLKDLYQRLVPRSIRHRLGEFYTPDWLAQRVVNQVTGSQTSLQPTKRILDPACGTGTFLIEVISRMIRTAGDSNPNRTLDKILENVVGFDLNPLAVQATKVNYLLAISPLLRHADAPIFLPVFLADSVSLPRRAGMLEGNVYVFETSEGDWRIPVPLVESGYLAPLGEIISQALRQGHNVEWVRKEISEKLPILTNVDQPIVDEVSALYDKIHDLHQANRDGMWWQMLTNAFAPALHGRFDFVVGNPPWVSWETLPEKYRRENDEHWVRYRLRPDVPLGRRQASSNVPVDLSMLFVSRCIDSYLTDGGRLGFVITWTVFQSELAGRGFRRRHLPPESSYSFVHIDDMSSLKVFEDATNQTSVVIADRKPTDRKRIPVTRWTGIQSQTIPTSLEIESATELTKRRNLFAEPVDPNDGASPLLIMPRAGLEASLAIRRRSPYLDSIRKGIDTRGANGIFFLDIADKEGAQLRVSNRPEDGRRHDVWQAEGFVESEAVKKLLRGEDVSPGEARPRLGLLLFHDDEHVSYPLTAEETRETFPRALEYISQFEGILRSRHRFRNFDPTGEYWLGIYSVTTAALARHKVVIREIARGMIAAPVHGADIIPDHKLYVIPCRTDEEADLLAMVLNSRVVSYTVRSFSISTSITGSFFRYIGIRDLSKAKPEQDPDLTIARALGITLDAYRTLDSIARAEL